MIKVFPKVIVTRVEVAFFDPIDQNLDFGSARQVPPYDKIFLVKSCLLLIANITNSKKLFPTC